MAQIRVIQSHRQPLPAPWYEICVRSVRDWSESLGYEHLWYDDALFDLVPEELRSKTASQPVITADLGRLRALELALLEGYDAAVWVDADVLVIEPQALALGDADYAFGREHWVQETAGGKCRVFTKVHNAFMVFRAGNPMLPFYRYAAERLVRRHQGPMAPQLVGPKFLSLLDNLLTFPVLENAAMLSPAVVRDVIAGQGPALDRFRMVSTVRPAAINLCGSMVTAGLLTDAQMGSVIEALQREPDQLMPVDAPASARNPGSTR